MSTEAGQEHRCLDSQSQDIVAWLQQEGEWPEVCLPLPSPISVYLLPLNCWVLALLAQGTSWCLFPEALD